MSGVLDRCENILAFEIGTVSENFFEAGAGRQQFQNIGNADAHTADARTTAALSVINGDAIEVFGLHVSTS